MEAKKIISLSKNWVQLDKQLEKLTKSSQSKLAGDTFELFTKYYLETAPQYRTLFKKVYLLKEVPSKIKQKLRLPDTDEGIDLITETFDKKYYAIQCKYRSDPNQTLTVKGDLATFSNLTFNYCKKISHAIVCATVNKPPKKVKLIKNVSYITIDTWLSLDDNQGEAFKLIQNKIKGKIIKPKKLNPRPHQNIAINKTLKHFKSNNRGKMIMPCGTGKSLTAFWIAKQLKAKTVLIAVPSLALLQQTLKVWTREYLINGINPEWLCVCSDDTVKDEQDDFITYTYDLGIKVTTDPRDIKSFLKKKSKLKIIFTTYQSGKMTAKGAKGFKFDLGIMDEAHKTVGSGSKPMAYLIHEKNIKIKNRLFMTATERLFRGDKDKYLSMNEPRDYGKLIYELSFKDAINSKPPIISDYKIVTFGITSPEVEDVYQSNKFLEVKKELKDITAREFATAIALRKAIKKLKIKNAISFHRSIKRADNFRQQQQLISKIFPGYGKLKSYHVAGEMPTSERANQMRSFSENKGLMTNARCLTEGVDLPAIDCVCFTDPKKSKVDIVQAAGRALRLSKGKKFGYILIPIFVPDHIELVEAAKEQGYDDVAITVRALATSDKRIVEYLRAISEGKKPKSGSPIDGKISINQLHKIEADEFDKAIKLKVWEKVAIGNWRSFEEAKKYVKDNKILNKFEFFKKYKKNEIPLDIPKGINKVYLNRGFKSWSDFFESYKIDQKDKSYLTASEIVQSLGYKSKGNKIAESVEKKFINQIKDKKITKKNMMGKIVKAYESSIVNQIIKKEKLLIKYNDKILLKRDEACDFINCSKDYFKNFESKLLPEGYVVSQTVNSKEPVFKKKDLIKYRLFFSKRTKLSKKYIQESKVKNLSKISIGIEHKTFRKKFKLKRIQLKVPGGRIEYYHDRKKINNIIKILENNFKIINNKKLMHLSEINTITGSRSSDFIHEAITNKKIKPIDYIWYKNSSKKTPYFNKKKIINFLKNYYRNIRQQRKYDNKFFLKRIEDYLSGKTLKKFRV
jgi:superfamily II DNA or RNA helicase